MSAKWNQNLRRIMYQKLKDEFGSVENWFSATNPTGSKEQYYEILDKIVKILNESPENLYNSDFNRKNILAQVAWAVQLTQTKCINKGYVINYISNRSVALEVGLISHKQIPKKCIFEY